MSEEKKSGFKVVDRRRITDEGEQRAGADVPQEDGGVTFSTFLQSLAHQGLMQMGLVPWPNGQRALAVEQAQETVELVELLKAKTRGNLTPAEQQVMNAVVHELTFRFAYADRRLPGDEATEQADVGHSDAEIAVTYVLDGAVDEDAVVRCIAAVAQAMHRPMPQRQGEEACWFANGRPVAQVVSDPDTGPSLGIVAELAIEHLDAIVAGVLKIRDRDTLAAAALRAPQALQQRWPTGTIRQRRCCLRLSTRSKDLLPPLKPA
jgi:hypothetical protein